MQPGGHRFDPGQLHQSFEMGPVAGATGCPKLDVSSDSGISSVMVKLARKSLDAELWAAMPNPLRWDAARRMIFDN